VLCSTLSSMNSAIHVLAPSSLTAAVKAAADRDLTNVSAYVRRALLHKLRADGVDLTDFAPPRSDAA
jgi:hypothetical protein